MKNQVIHIFVPGEEPTGVKILEVAGWTGKVFIIPRNKLKEVKNRPEINKPAVYFLIGSNEDTTQQNVYIGESESFYGRLENHYLNKDFWNLAIVFTGEQLDRADVKYLETKATKLAKEAKRYDVQNIMPLYENTLSEFKKVSADDYFERLNYILAVLNFPIFESIEDSIEDEKVYTFNHDGLTAKGKLLKDGTFLVLKGSEARIKETSAFMLGGFGHTAREKFIKTGMFELNVEKNCYIFSEDTLFRSPSGAAASVAGRAANGWTSWKDNSNKTLDENVRK